jgi:uncharacterized protein
MSGMQFVAGEAYDPRYLEGLRHFNAREFFVAHEVWEELWRDERGRARQFYQGLIQAAVCLHHFGHGNTRGARKLYHSSRGYLDGYRPLYLGLDLERLLADLQRCCADLVASQDDFPRVPLSSELIPELHFEPPADPTP